MHDDESSLTPSAGYRSEKSLTESKEDPKTYAGIPIKLNEEGKVRSRWPTAKTALKADLQKLELLETLTGFIGEPHNRRYGHQP